MVLLRALAWWKSSAIISYDLGDYHLMISAIIAYALAWWKKAEHESHIQLPWLIAQSESSRSSSNTAAPCEMETERSG